MKKKTKKKLLAGTLSAAVAASAVPYAVLAASYQDTAGHWAEGAIDRWSGHGLIEGYNGSFQPDAAVTRAEMAVIIDRLMKYQETGENPFLDLQDAWYKDAVQRAAAGHVLLGFNGYVRPEEPVTREEAAVMMARALHLPPETEHTPGYTDRNDIADWAAEYVAAMDKKGYMQGFEDGTFRPRELMTRAYAVQMTDHIVKGYYSKAGTYTDTVEGLVLVNTPGVIFKNMKIDDILLAPGLGENKVVLQNSTITGTQTILAGSISVIGGSHIGGGSGGSGGGSGGSSGGGSGSTIIDAAKTSIVVNADYSGKTGTVTVDRRRYTYGENAFGSLQEALAKAKTLEEKATVTLTGDLETGETVVADVQELTLDGGGHRLTVNKTENGKKDGIQLTGNGSVDIVNLSLRLNGTEEQWSGSYGIQVYQTALNIGNVSISGSDAAMLINGGDVTITGQLDLSENTFGGIELSKGTGVTADPMLRGNREHLIYRDEETNRPLIWIDKADQINAFVEINDLFSEIVDKNGTQQRHYYLDFDNLSQKDMAVKVNSGAELLDAVNNPAVRSIHLNQDITVTGPVEIGRVMVLNGHGHTITAPAGAKSVMILSASAETRDTGQAAEISDVNLVFSGAAPLEWASVYGLHVYEANRVTLRNIKASNGNAGILVNGSSVNLEGEIDVAGNTFGGIEISKGAGVTKDPSLTGSEIQLKNTTEAPGKPTVWTDGVGEEAMQLPGLRKAYIEDRDQYHYFLRATNLPLATATAAPTAGQEEVPPPAPPDAQRTAR